MLKRFCAVTAILLVCGGLVSAQPPAPAASPAKLTAIKAGRLIDPETGTAAMPATDVSAATSVRRAAASAASMADPASIAPVAL